MKQETKDKLKIAMDICDTEDRSTEYMIQFMQDFAGVSFDCVISFLEKQAREEK